MELGDSPVRGRNNDQPIDILPPSPESKKDPSKSKGKVTMLEEEMELK